MTCSMTKKNSILYLNPEDKKMINSVAWRMMVGSAPYQYEKMQALSFLYAMVPVVKRYYKDDKEKRIEAYKRHWELWNTTPQVAGLAAGLAAAMEREASMNPDYDVSSINATKVSLMGPLAGIGDSIFWGSLKVIATGIGVSFALQGNILGPILYFLVYNIPSSLARHLLPVIGFNLGTSFFEKMNKNGFMPFLTECCNIVGLIMVGSMACTMVTLKVPFVYETEGATINVQEILDSILPNALPLGLTLLCFWLLKKKNVSPTILIILLVVVAIALHAVGIL